MKRTNIFSDTLQEGPASGFPYVINRTRLQDAIDCELVSRSKIVIIGTGGMYCGAEMFARTGFGEIVAVDPDTVDEVNICRQGYHHSQLGHKKVDALGEHLREVNPAIRYTGYASRIQDLSPELLDKVFSDASIAIFTTDSFEAQAYGNKIVLHYGICGIWAGFYEASLAAEVVFYIPGVTPGCFRCAVSPRYAFQEKVIREGGKEFGITSQSNTIFHSALLDSIIGMLTLAIIHNDTEGKTYSHWFGSYWDRNLLQIKVNPSYTSGIFNRVFAANGDNTYLFETVWQRIERETPPKYAPCQDCCLLKTAIDDVFNDNNH